MSAWLDVELQRLRAWLGTAPGPEHDPRDESLRAGCERMQAVLLERRIERELARPSVGWSADGLWAERFHLSRLQTQVETLELDAFRRRSGTRPAAWLASLDQRRTELAADAVDRVSSLEPPSRAEACELIVQTAVDEVGETIAFLEDMPLRRAVKRLELDAGGPGTAGGIMLALVARAEERGRSIVAAAIRPRRRRARTRKTSRINRTTDDQDQAAVERLRRQARRAERLSRRVRGAWQEKLLALRMQTLFGRRFVADPGKHGPRPDPGPLRVDRGRGRARANFRGQGSRSGSTSSSPGRIWPSARCSSSSLPSSWRSPPTG